MSRLLLSQRLVVCCVLLTALCPDAAARQSYIDGDERRDEGWFLAKGAVNQPDPAVSPAPPAEGTPVLPNGATSISEVYGAWTVQCRVVSNNKLCTLNQVLANPETEQVGFAIDLLPSMEGSVSGHVLLPLGIRLADGLVLQVDKRDPAPKLPFTHCVATGCIAPVLFDAPNTKVLETGTMLTARVTVEASGQPLSFRVSLAGFAPAMARTLQLQQ